MLRARVKEARRGSLVLGFVLVSLNGLAESNPAGFAIATSLLASAIWKALESIVAHARSASADKRAEIAPGTVNGGRQLLGIAADPSVDAMVIETKENPPLRFPSEDMLSAVSLLYGEELRERDYPMGEARADHQNR